MLKQKQKQNAFFYASLFLLTINDSVAKRIKCESSANILIYDLLFITLSHFIPVKFNFSFCPQWKLYFLTFLWFYPCFFFSFKNFSYLNYPPSKPFCKQHLTNTSSADKNSSGETQQFIFHSWEVCCGSGPWSRALSFFSWLRIQEKLVDMAPPYQ